MILYFSPDGIVLLPRINNKVVLKPITDDVLCCPILVEIKNPWSRKLTNEGDDIPPEYMAQIQAGLISIPLTHSAIFIDCATKLCSYEQFFENGFNSSLYNNKYIPPIDSDIISKGIILITGKLPVDFWKKDCGLVEVGTKTIFDIGDCSYKNVFAVVKNCKTDALNAEYFPLHNGNDAEYIEKLTEKVESSKIIGVICYKIFDITYNIIPRNKEMIKTIRGELDKYSKGALDVDEDYVARKRKRSQSVNGLPNLEFDFDFDSDKEADKDKFSFDD